MRILQVTSYYFPEVKYGGPPLKIHSLSRGCLRLGHAVEVVTVHSEQRRRRDSVAYDGVPVHYLPWLGWSTRHFPYGLSRLRKAVLRSDVVHCYGLYNLLGPWAFYFARKTRRPCVLEPVGMFKPQLRSVALKRCYHETFTYRMFRQAACVIAASRTEADTMAGFVSADKLIVRPNGIDVTTFQSLPSGSEFRDRFGLEPGEKVVLFLGRISRVKNLEALVRAFGVARLSGWRLLLAGPQLEPDYTAVLLRQIQCLPSPDSVMLTGPLYEKDKLAALAAADIFALPSISESFGNAAAEAVAAGIPVLISHGCGVASLIDGRAGLSVASESAEIAQGLRRLSDPSERAAVTQRRAEVVRELSWEGPVAQMAQIYRRFVNVTSE